MTHQQLSFLGPLGFADTQDLERSLLIVEEEIKMSEQLGPTAYIEDRLSCLEALALINSELSRRNRRETLK